MSKILKTHPKSVQSHKDLILQCLDDKDESIRLRALDLLYGMVWSNVNSFIYCTRLCFIYSNRDVFKYVCLSTHLKNIIACNLTVLLMSGFQVSKKNLMEIVKKLMLHVDKAEGTTYRDELLTKIIDICSQSNYQYITNFEWSVSAQHPHLVVF